MFNIKSDSMKSANLFLGGLALGTAGIRILTSKDAKKVYSHILAAGLRAKENVMETADALQASAQDILAEAYDINEQREDELFEEMEAELAEEIETEVVDVKAKKTSKTSK